MSGSWLRLLEELIVSAITGERRAVVEKLDVLVKGYRPAYEFHGVPQNRDVDGIRRTPTESSKESRFCG